MRSRTFLVLTALVSLGFQTGGKAPFVDSIRKEEMKADVYFLSSDRLEGRLTGTSTNLIAAEWIKSRFQRIGLKPVAADSSFYHTYNLMTATLGPDNAMELRNGGVALKPKPGQDYFPQMFSASAQAEGPLAYVGFGLTDPKLGYDDYRGHDLAGVIVLVLDHEPGERDEKSPFEGMVQSEASSPLRKTLLAQERGAAGILFVRDVHNHRGVQNFESLARSYWPEQPRIPRYTLAGWADKVRIPAAQVSTALAEMLVQGSGRTLGELSKSAETPNGLGAVPLPGTQVKITTDVDRHTIVDRNVVGLIEGSDPKLKDEHIIVCGHYDHNGTDGSQVYPGADDDASGTVATVAIADAFVQAANAGQRPRRSILFAAWNSEERGLLGAWAYAEDPLLPRDKIVAVLNLDMISRDEEVQAGGGGRFAGLEIQTAESNENSVNVIGTLRSPDMKAETETANRDIGLDLKFRYDNNPSNLMRRSDHWPFVQHGIPGIWFFTGLHPDYHTVYDRPEKLNYTKMEKVTRLVYQEAWNLANQEKRPRLLPRGTGGS